MQQPKIFDPNAQAAAIVQRGTRRERPIVTGASGTLQIVKAKTCQYCHHGIEAIAANRTILVCRNRQGCETKLHVGAPNDACGNYRPNVEIAAGSEPALPQSDGSRLIPLTRGKFAIVNGNP